MPDRLLSTFQVADLLGATPGAVVEWIQKGLLPVQRLDDGSLRTSREALIQFLKTRGQEIEPVLARLGATAGPRDAAMVSGRDLPRLDLAELQDEVAPHQAGPEDIERLFPLDPTAVEQGPPMEAQAVGEEEPSPAANQDEEWRLAEQEGQEEHPAPPEPPAPQPPEPEEPELLSVEADQGEPMPEEAEPLPPIEPDLTPPGQDIPDIAAIPATEPQAQEPAPTELPSAPVEDEGTYEPVVATPQVEELPPIERAAAPAEDEEPFEAAVAPQAPEACEAAVKLVRDALARRAGDIHIESTARELSIRLRIDGVLHDAARCGLEISQATAAEAMRELLDLVGTRRADARRPSVGQANLTFGEREVAVTVATCPTAFGQRMVVTLSDPQAAPPTLSMLALPQDEEQRLARVLAGRSGLVLLVARPGEERIAALAAMVSVIRTEPCSVVMVSHRPTVPLAGVTAIMADATADFPLAQAVRAAAEQDADAIIVDDLRDEQTLPALLEAVEAGRLALAAIAAPGAAAAVVELAELGAEPWVLANCLKAAVTTTPLRRLCPHCRRQAAPGEEILARLGLMREEVGRAFVAGACGRCAGVGYLGLVGCSSLMLMDRELAAALRGKVERVPLAAAVAQAGGRPLLQVGLDMVRDGLTSLEELARCLPQ